MKPKRLLKQRYASIQEAKDAKTFGILVGLKPGQKHLDDALKTKALAEKHGKTAYLLAGREITPERSNGVPRHRRLREHGLSTHLLGCAWKI